MLVLVFYPANLSTHSVYSASKAAVRSFARCWSVDLKDRKIRVNVVSPGLTKTPLALQVSGGSEEAWQSRAKIYSDIVPLSRVGQPDEIAKPVVFLASDDSLYITGIELFVDGGQSTQKRLSPQASWNQNGITITGCSNGSNGSSLYKFNQPLGISITDNDILYIADKMNHRVVVIHLDSTKETFSIGSGDGFKPVQFSIPHDIFIFNTSLYVLEQGSHKRVQKMLLNGSDPITVPSVTGLISPTYLYIDINGSIYVSDIYYHSVFVFRSNSTNGSIVAGTGVKGSTNETLDSPYGIYVNNVGTIYIADRYNNRIMKWLAGELSGVRVAGNEIAGNSSTQLNSPTYIIVDENDYMYISEAFSARVTRWAPNSTCGTCIVGCSGNYGSAPSQLERPHSLAFDSNGSLYVSDYGNHRVQKFQLLNSPVPYNQPKIDYNTTWDQCGITFANKCILPTRPHGIFIDSNDSIYIANYEKDRILILSKEGNILERRLIVKLFRYTSLFVTLNGDIYFENGNESGRIEKFTSNSTNSDFVTKFSGHCYSLFVDIRNTLYCSIPWEHRVVKILLDRDIKTSITTAGTKSDGSGSHQLDDPWGIFVDIHFNLYVADTSNNRIQLFRPGELNGTTVAGNNIPNNLILNRPTDVILDTDGYLYIADNDNHRIIQVRNDTFHCVVGCTGKSGSASNELNKTYGLRFDSSGNLYVVDEFNSRIQKFSVSHNSCGTPTTTNSTSESTTTISTPESTTTTSTPESITTISTSESTTTNSTPESTTTTSTPESTTTTSTSESTTTVSTSESTTTISTPRSTTTISTAKFTSSISTSESTTTYLPETSEYNHSTSLLFVAPLCENSTNIGINCNVSGTICDMGNPCLNDGNCSNIKNNQDYDCLCQPDFNGKQCQFDQRLCKENTCFNNGICDTILDSTFNCTCALGYEGVCRPLLLGYSCECLKGSYYGEHCEITTRRIIIYQIVSKSFAYIAILAMISVAIFIIVMDILKYGFGIDLTRREVEQIRREKQAKKRKQVTQRLIYVNAIP
ncbi:unnamed protein product [Adineta steineri]|uniref:EGF-like domain-containing protein n=2 Tax=Adineta steineri TaxID=433720 RepID=A0A815JK83_9BILA|nr:unnamed protein product [Adineta steineri]